ncbi:MAG: nucleotidyl transferase AbiEii/AbiGii toxin family protein [Clostridiales bacterium]|nr:nucleotidyl transferase AbiEii/AbiGii toxin family protein [Clostridiales bacterium]
MINIVASVLARLKNKSKEEDILFQQLLNIFCQEEFIRRLSESRYRENLILKGGYLLYSVSGFTTRPTIDADFLLKNYSNDIIAIEKLVREIISQSSKNDFIEFQIIKLEKISEVKDYHGIRANLLGVIGRTQTPFSIDFGVGDIIVPSPVERTISVLLPEFEKPNVLTYTLESTVAEKIDAIISLMEATGRMKDFYDIYYLATSFDFEGRKLQEAIYETLTNRNTPYEKDSVAVIERLADNKEIQKRWNNFCKKVLKYELDLEIVINTIIDFTLPPFEKIIEEDEFFKNWKYRDRKYI